MRTITRVFLVLALVAGSVGLAYARSDAADLKREIDIQRSGVSDLERLDTSHASAGEIALLRSWIDEADADFGKEDYDHVREVLDRNTAQAELIRQSITTAQVKKEASDRDAELAQLRDRIKKTQAALEQAKVTKKALEMNAK